MPGVINSVPLFDSKQFRWADMSVSLFGAKVAAIHELTYDVEQEDEPLYGAGDEPIDIQSGNRKYTASLVLLKSAFDAITTAAQLAGYKDILGLRFPVTISYTNDTRITTDVLVNCKISKYNDGMKQGEKFNTITLPIMFTSIRKNV